MTPASEIVWDDRRKAGGARTIVYAGPRASATRSSAGVLFAICSGAFVWAGHKHLSEQPLWILAVFAMFGVVGLAVAAASWPGSSGGRIEVKPGKLRFVNRGVLTADVELTLANVAGFSVGGSLLDQRQHVFASMRTSARVKLATFDTVTAANALVHALDQLAAGG